MYCAWLFCASLPVISPAHLLTFLFGAYSSLKLLGRRASGSFPCDTSFLFALDIELQIIAVN